MHIPSALSQLYYLDYIFSNGLVTKDWNIVIGKPFGAEAYYYTWEKNGWLDTTIKPISEYSYGIKHKELPFVNFSEETLGNALGVAAGISLVSDKPTWVNISDAALQMGPTYEAIQFIGQNQLQMVVTIDFNKMQLTGPLADNKLHSSYIQLFEINDWEVWDIYINPKINLVRSFDEQFKKVSNCQELKVKPVVIFIHTIKGDGVLEMEIDSVKWHYKNLESLKHLNGLTISDKLKKMKFLERFIK
jgi:transketolase N-terminal domain/subunit